MKNFRSYRLATLALAAVPWIVGAPAASAQDRLDPAGMGAARASVATTRGLGAVMSNPGALDLPVLDKITLDQDVIFSIYSFGGTSGSTYLNGDDFRQIFAPKPEGISASDRRRIGQLLQDEKLFANGGINLLTLRYKTDGGGTFGFHYGHRVFARVNFPSDLSRLIETSNITGQDYRFVNRGIGGDWVTEFGFSYGKNIGSLTESGWLPSVGVGLTAKLVQGIAHFEVASNSIITIDQVVANGSGGYRVQGGYMFRSAQPENFDQANAVNQLFSALFPSTAGSGFGLNAGVAGVLYRREGKEGETNRDAIMFGLEVQDLGKVSWNTKTYVRSLTGVNDTLASGSLSDEQFKRYEGTLEPVVDYTTALPSVFRAGIGVNVGAYREMDGTLVIGIEGEAPLNDIPGNSPDPRLSIGADWGVNDWLAVRGGVNGGGANGFGVGLGVGLRPYEWLSVDLGSSEIEGVFGSQRVDFAARVGIGWIW